MVAKRCLVLSCSQAKRADAVLLPAIERYDGPAFRVVRKFLREAPPDLQNVDIFVLSAQYGLIAADEPIADYDQRMTVARARELRDGVFSTFQERIAQAGYGEVFLSLGRNYLAALNGCEALLPSESLVVSRSSSGKKLAELRAWLYGQQHSEQSERASVPLARLQRWEKGRSVIRGVLIEMTPDEVLVAARQALAEGRGNPTNYRSWYVQVDDQRVGPKWLVSQLAGLPVSAFVADEARRVLRQLGIQVHRNE